MCILCPHGLFIESLQIQNVVKQQKNKPSLYSLVCSKSELIYFDTVYMYMYVEMYMYICLYVYNYVITALLVHTVTNLSERGTL